jgi:hypothetical protein
MADKTKETDQTIGAMRSILEILEPLPQEGRIRALRAVVAFYNLKEDLED